MSAQNLGVRFTPGPLADRVAKELLSRSGAKESAGFLDPACGEGELLLAVWRASGRSSRLARGGLFGIEVDPARAERARTRLIEEIGGADGRAAADNVRTGDGLDPAQPWPPHTHVLANPPWVSLSGRQSVRLPEAQRSAYLEAWPATGTWPSLHGAFLERIARHLHAQKTKAVVLLPASVADLEGYAPLRRVVTAHTTLYDPPIKLGADAFPGVNEPGLVLFLENRARRGKGSEASWLREWTEAERQWVEQLRAFPPLPPDCFRDCGVHTGNASAELLFDDPRPGDHLIREGKDLQPYALGPPRLGLRAELEATEERRFRIGSLERYRSIPILLRQTANRPIAALHTEPTYFRNTLLACSPPPGLAPAFVVAVLNSGIAAKWHALHFADAKQRVFPQVKIRHLRSLPFPILKRAKNPSLHDTLASYALRRTSSDASDLATESEVFESLSRSFLPPEDVSP